MTAQRLTASIAMIVCIAFVMAVPAAIAVSEQSALPGIETSNMTTVSQQHSLDEKASWIVRNIPALQQALILFTSVNAILIVFGGVAYLLKKRMENETASTLASIKDKQDHT